MTTTPTVTKRPHRDEHGRFLPGCPPGPGNPFAARVAELRAALYSAVTPQDVASVVRALVQEAQLGDVAAAKCLLERLLGRPLEADILERIEALEARLAQQDDIKTR